MATKEHVLHLRRHLGARDPILVGEEIEIPGTGGKRAIVDNGVYIDGEAHLEVEEYQRAEEIGRMLYIPTDEEVKLFLVASSPLPRAQETERHLFLGMAKQYAARVFSIKNPRKMSEEERRILMKRGLHKLAVYEPCEDVAEPDYKNTQGELDNGNELVAEAYEPTVNPSFPGYRWMVQKGFLNDQRSQHPKTIADNALGELLYRLADNDVLLCVTHQPNLEIITAALIGDIGNDANETFNNAGGQFDVGGGIELRMYTDNNKIVEACLTRTEDADKKKGLGDKYNGVTLVKTLEPCMDVLRKYTGLAD